MTAVPRALPALVAASFLLSLLAACGGGGSAEATPDGVGTLPGQARVDDPPAASPATAPSPAPPGDGAPAPSAPDMIVSTCVPGVTVADALAQVNAARATGRMCDTTWYPPAPPLAWNASLGQAAGAHSLDMAANNYFSHTGQNGSTAGSRALAAGYSASSVGENIHAGRSSMESAIAGWLQSPGHCRNIMNARYRDYGIGCAYDASSQYRTYWTQNFGTPR